MLSYSILRLFFIQISCNYISVKINQSVMQRNTLIPYLTALFSGGTPSGADFKQLIEGLGTQLDRPHIVCVSDFDNIPDNQLLVTTYATASTTMPNGCGCSSLPAPSGSKSVIAKSEKVINILCDYFKEGWAIECVGKCTGSLCARAYYYVVSMDATTNTYEVVSLQFNNPKHDKNGYSSASCVRVLRMMYNRRSGCITETDSRLLLSDATPVVRSNDVRSIKVVYNEPPMVEDGVLYIQVKLSPLMTPEASITELSQSAVTISWPAITGAVHYEVRNGDTVHTTTATTYTFTGLQPDSMYTFGVRAIADGKTYSNSSWKYVVTETKNSVILQTPAIRVTSTDADRGVVASWDAVQGATSYSYRVGCGCDCAPLITGITTTSVTIFGLMPNQPYTLQVKAVSNEEAVLDSDWAAVGFTTK